MPARRTWGWAYLACLWLSLATVFAHAVLPAGSPIMRGQGSAFSFATTDVSLAPSRRDKARKNALEARSHGPDSANAGNLQAVISPSIAPEPLLAIAADHRIDPTAGALSDGRTTNQARAPPTA